MDMLSAFLFVLLSWAVYPLDSYSLSRKSCQPGYVSCQLGQNWHKVSDPCLEETKVCDNTTDCSDGSDEKYCPFNYNYGEVGFIYRFVQGPCPEDYFMCPSGKHIYIRGRHVYDGDSRCIHKTWLCDDEVDCGEHSDESYCPYNVSTGFQYEVSECPTGYFLCRTTTTSQRDNGDKCLPKTSLCDGKKDCNNGVDELYCPYVFPWELKPTVPFINVMTERTTVTTTTVKTTTTHKPEVVTVRHISSTLVPTTKTTRSEQVTPRTIIRNVSNILTGNVSNLLDKKQFNSQISSIQDQLKANNHMLTFLVSLSIFITILVTYFVVSNYLHRRHCYRFQDVHLLHLPNSDN